MLCCLCKETPQHIKRIVYPKKIKILSEFTLLWDKKGEALKNVQAVYFIQQKHTVGY